VNEFDRIATALERIADALESTATPERREQDKSAHVIARAAVRHAERRAEARRIAARHPRLTFTQIAERMDLSDRSLRYAFEAVGERFRR